MTNLPAGASNTPRLNEGPNRFNRQSVGHAARTAIAAVVSLEVAHLFKLPEAYWASISTLIVMQSTLGVALGISTYRFAGTALGAAVAALVATYIGTGDAVFCIAVFGVGLLCAALRLGRNAYRLASVTLAIVLLTNHMNAAWIVAIHRFVEVTIGIGVGLAIMAVWPERPAAPNTTDTRGG